MAKLWVGVDIGKEHHHIAAVNADGKLVYSRRVANDERALLAAMAEVSSAGRAVCWAVDVTNSLAALVLALLWRRQVEVRYVSGTVAFHMAAAFAGENKTDAADAAVIAHTIRMRPDLPVLKPADHTLAALKILTGYRADLVGQRTASLYRLQALMTGISPALERSADFNRKGPVMVLACWQTPAAIRHAGVDRIEALLRRGHVSNAPVVADAMVTAARQQTITLPGQRAAATVVAQLATEILTLDQRIDVLDEQIVEHVEGHAVGDIVRSMPGMGAQLTAELLVFTDNMTEHTSAAKLAAHAGLAPVSRDSGAVAGNHRGARRFHRGLRRIFWMSAFTALSHCAASRTYYDRKRAEGRDHRHAMLALARRRVDVLWALVRDQKPYAPPVPRTT